MEEKTEVKSSWWGAEYHLGSDALAPGQGLCSYDAGSKTSSPSENTMKKGLPRLPTELLGLCAEGGYDRME